VTNKEKVVRLCSRETKGAGRRLLRGSHDTGNHLSRSGRGSGVQKRGAGAEGSGEGRDASVVERGRRRSKRWGQGRRRGGDGGGAGTPRNELAFSVAVKCEITLEEHRSSGERRRSRGEGQRGKRGEVHQRRGEGSVMTPASIEIDGASTREGIS